MAHCRNDKPEMGYIHRKTSEPMADVPAPTREYAVISTRLGRIVRLNNVPAPLVAVTLDRNHVDRLPVTVLSAKIESLYIVYPIRNLKASGYLATPLTSSMTKCISYTALLNRWK